MLKFIKTPSSIKIFTPETSITVFVKNGEVLVEQSFSGPADKSAMKATNAVKNLLKRIDKKANYQKRFAKIVSVIGSQSITSFRILENRCDKWQPTAKLAQTIENQFAA